MANLYAPNQQTALTEQNDVERFSDLTNGTLIGFLKVMWPFLAIITLGSLAASFVSAKKEKGGGGKGGGKEKGK